MLSEAAQLLSSLTSEQKLLGAASVLTLAGMGLSTSGLAQALVRVKQLSTFRFSPKGKLRNHVQIGPIRISDQARLRHTHIVGATGTGKTVLLEQLICQDLARGNGALIIDPKGDRELYDRIKAFCRRIGREKDLKLISATYLDESVRWNPCRVGSASELQSKWFQSGVYMESFYAKACELGLLQALNRLVVQMPRGFTLNDLVSAIERQARSEKNSHLKGLSYELYNIAIGEWGPILCCSRLRDTREEISLLDITRKNEILFVDLPTESKAVQSSRLGKLLLQELMLISGMRKVYPSLRSERAFSVYVDEFDAFATESFSTFLNKGRSSGFMIHIAHQTLSDLDKVSEVFRGQILGNCSVRFIFRQDDPDDAETWARFIGTKKVLKRTFQSKDGTATGMSSNRETQEFRVNPDEIKGLRIGEFVFSEKTAGKYQKVKLGFPVSLPMIPKLPTERSETERVDAPEPDINQMQDRLQHLIEPELTNEEELKR